MKTILVTGGSGQMGGCIAEDLRANGYNVISTGRKENAARGITRLDVRDGARCQELTRGVDVIIHMGFYTKPGEFLEEQVPTNIVGTWNLYEAAARNNVSRIIFGSSNHAVGFHLRPGHPQDDAAQRPDSPYGLSKCFAEMCGQYFSDRFGISVINVRIGTYSHSDDHLPYSRRRCRTWLSPRDCRQLFRKCVEADESIKFLNIFGVSTNAGSEFGVSSLKDLIGYEPQDDGMVHLEHAVSVDRWNGRDDNAFLGADLVAFNPLTGSFDFDDLPELEKRHKGAGK